MTTAIHGRDTGTHFDPAFDKSGLITAVVCEALSKDVLMVAHMNADALRLTQQTGIAHFWSRSRQALWRKGETSGNELKVGEIRVDCDQDAVLLFVTPTGPACHTGARSCFYRMADENRLVPIPSTTP